MQPRWDDRDESMLWAPEPRVEASRGGMYSVMAPSERLHDSDAFIEYVVLYVVSCSAGGEDLEAFEGEIDGLIETFQFLPSEGHD